MAGEFDELDRLVGKIAERAEAATAKEYLGDGVYVETEVGQLILTTEDGISTTNRIVLEADVYAALLQYVKRQQGVGID